MKKLHNKSGAVFITVLIISMLILFVAASSSNMLLQDAKMIRYLKRSAQARYLAEAGVNAALGVLLEEGISAKGDALNFPETNMGDGSYDVTVIESGDRILLSSVGIVDGTSRTVSAEVQDLYPEALDYPLATGGDLGIKAVQGNVTVKGNVHANGNLNFSEQGPNTQLKVEAYLGRVGPLPQAAAGQHPETCQLLIWRIQAAASHWSACRILTLDISSRLLKTQALIIQGA